LELLILKFGWVVCPEAKLFKYSRSLLERESFKEIVASSIFLYSTCFDIPSAADLEFLKVFLNVEITSLLALMQLVLEIL
jgi:hypothetical protein